jgi:hypothetical protein
MKKKFFAGTPMHCSKLYNVPKKMTERMFFHLEKLSRIIIDNVKTNQGMSNNQLGPNLDSAELQANMNICF